MEYPEYAAFHPFGHPPLHPFGLNRLVWNDCFLARPFICLYFLFVMSFTPNEMASSVSPKGFPTGVRALPPPKPASGNGLRWVFPARVRPDSPSRGDAFLLSTLLNRSFGCLEVEVGLGHNHGDRQVDQPRRASNF